MKAGLCAFVLSIALIHTLDVMAATKADASAPQASPRISVAPKGHYGALDSLPDWGGAWFVNFAPGARSAPPPRLKGDYLAAYEKWQAEVQAKDGVVAAS